MKIIVKTVIGDGWSCMANQIITLDVESSKTKREFRPTTSVSYSVERNSKTAQHYLIIISNESVLYLVPRFHHGNRATK